jgi:integrase
MRVPNVSALEKSGRLPTLRVAATQWKATRLDVSEGTLATYDVALGRILPTLGTASLDTITVTNVAELVARLHADGLKRQTIRKTVSVLAMVLDHARVNPNPARDKQTVKLPREERRQLQPPSADHVTDAVRLLPSRYRLPTLVLDATGMRIGELEALSWGDIDEPRGRWRIATSKTGRPRWITPPAAIFEAVTALVPRDDRVPERPVFEGFGSDRYRTALTRACTAAGIPLFSPHDLRHRRVSLLHLSGTPWARIGEIVGHDDITTTSRVYTHVLADETEVDYVTLATASFRHGPDA